MLALDHGRARTGVAVSDPTGTIVRPLRPIERVESRGGGAMLDRVIAAEQPELILIGDPKLMSGRAGEQAQAARTFAANLRERVTVPVEMLDERLTTVEASRRKGESGSATSVDSLAACVLLESYLAAR